MNTPTDLRAITVRPPWSWAIARAGKTVENRPRPTSYRGQIAVHAGSRWDKAGASDRRVRAAWHRYIAELLDGGVAVARDDLVPADPSIVMGAVVAIAELTDCHVKGVKCGSREQCRRWGAPGQFHLVLGNVQPLARPVPCLGQLALPWRIPGDVAAEVLAQLPEGAAV